MRHNHNLLVLLFGLFAACDSTFASTAAKTPTSTKIAPSVERKVNNVAGTTNATTSTQSAATKACPRPALVTEALEKGQDLYYFGLGSNMLRSKIENRAVCGSKIHIKSMQPALVKNYRLAFNMRGFPPLEPGMGSLEPTGDGNMEDAATPLHPYKAPECHGALVKLSADDYVKVMRSEGVPSDNQGYEEVVVDAIPYESDSSNKRIRGSPKQQQPVKAIALRARTHVRLPMDPAPSQRYMKILTEGAKELGLAPCYQDFLQQHPVADPWPLTRKIAVFNLIFTSKVAFQYKIRIISKLQSWFLWKVYVPPNNHSKILKAFHELAMMLILLPGAIPGCLLFWYMRLRNNMSPMMKIMVDNHW